MLKLSSVYKPGIHISAWFDLASVYIRSDAHLKIIYKHFFLFFSIVNLIPILSKSQNK